MWYVVSYDVSDNKRRNKVAKLLDDYGDRVQYSVFEVPINKPEQVEELLARLTKVLDLAKDSVYLHPVCARCREDTVVVGQGTAFDEDYVWIV